MISLFFALFVIAGLSPLHVLICHLEKYLDCDCTLTVSVVVVLYPPLLSPTISTSYVFLESPYLVMLSPTTEDCEIHHHD